MTPQISHIKEIVFIYEGVCDVYFLLSTMSKQFQRSHIKSGYIHFVYVPFTFKTFKECTDDWQMPS